MPTVWKRSDKNELTNTVKQIYVTFRVMHSLFNKPGFKTISRFYQFMYKVFLMTEA